MEPSVHRGGQPITVPGDARTIQAAIDAAADGDTVVVAPGTYREALTIRGKNVVLGSRFLTTGDTLYVAQTIVDGGGSEGAVLHVEDTREDATAHRLSGTLRPAVRPRREYHPRQRHGRHRMHE